MVFLSYYGQSEKGGTKRPPPPMARDVFETLQLVGLNLKWLDG